MIGATGSGCGKTTLMCALLAYYKHNKQKVAAFKAGPDYIDPMFHQEVLQTDSYNLDLFMLGEEKCKTLLQTHGKEKDLCLMEGVMGYYDGIKDTSQSSACELALKTKTPSILVLSCKGMGLSVCAVIKGYLAFQDNTIQGVVLNGVKPMSYPYYKELIEKHTPIKVYGYMPYIEEARLESRHLGLVTAKEVQNLQEKIEHLRKETENTIDFEGLLELAQTAEPLSGKALSKKEQSALETPRERIKIGIAKDEAFCFYYQDALTYLESLGAELVPFSPLKDAKLPEGICGLLLGGGYPELHLKALQENQTMKKSIYEALESGMPCVAECGGFMYLQKGITPLEGEKYEMVGYLEGQAKMQTRLGPFGYRELIAKEDNLLLEKGESFYGHEFHYSISTHTGESCIAKKPLTNRQWECVVATKTLFASYIHLHFYGNEKAAKRFITQCKEYKRWEQ